MARRPSTTEADAAALRALQARLPDLSVPALLRVRDAVDDLVRRPSLRHPDVATVLAAAEPR